jgi:hypothetical protein
VRGAVRYIDNQSSFGTLIQLKKTILWKAKCRVTAESRARPHGDKHCKHRSFEYEDIGKGPVGRYRRSSPRDKIRMGPSRSDDRIWERE